MHTSRRAPLRAALALTIGMLAACSTPIVPPGHTSPVCVREGKDAPVPPIRMGDQRTVARILDEGKHRNQVMDHLRYLTQKVGPRLTGSSSAERANNWTLGKFRSWGLDARLYQWGEIPVRFDRGPSTGRLFTKETKKKEDGSVEEKWTAARDFQFTTLAWTRGTSGPVRGPVIPVPSTDEEYAKVKDRLKGAWILLDRLPTAKTVRDAARLAGERFKARIEARERIAKGESVGSLHLEERLIFDGIAGFISAPDDQRDRVWTSAVPGWRERTVDQIPPDIEVLVRLADHDNMRERLAEGQEFQVEFDLPHTLTPGPIPVYDTIAEIRGTEKPGEVIVVCGHLDSWNGPGSQGCTDNGTGSMVALEAARILMATHARPKRTIRFCLWTGEEQGLLGSKEYVKSLGDGINKVSVCLNDDGGTNYEGGLKCTADMADYLAAATAPVNYQFADSMDDKPMIVSIQVVPEFLRGGGSDHASFTKAGVPGFFWDEVGRADYSQGWHTQHDRFDLAIREYLEQSATCQAITAYNLACAPELLPRVPPEPPSPSDQDRPAPDAAKPPSVAPSTK